MIIGEDIELESIKAAVVGVGYLGKFHAEKYASSAQAELVAVVDSDLSRAREVADKFNVKALSDYRELAESGVQCASIASSTGSHFEVASNLLSQGMDILVEKPMTVTVDEARELNRLAEQGKRILQVGHLERFNPAFRAAKESLSRPVFFEVRRISPFSGRGHDVDVVLDLMIHDIDIVTHLVGRPVENISAVGASVLTDSCDIASARLKFNGGAVANVTASRASFKSERSLRVFQKDVYISLDYGSKKLKIYRRNASEGSELPQIEIKEFDLEKGDALKDEVESFLEAVRTRCAPLVTGEDGLRALKLARTIQDAISESSREIESSSELISEIATPEVLQEEIAAGQSAFINGSGEQRKR